MLACEPLTTLGAHERFAVGMRQNVFLQVPLTVSAPAANVASFGA